MDNPPSPPPQYQSYLLRYWPVQEERGVRWRASLENPLTGAWIGFPSMAALASFLQEQTQIPDGIPDLQQGSQSFSSGGEQ